MLVVYMKVKDFLPNRPLVYCFMATGSDIKTTVTILAVLTSLEIVSIAQLLVIVFVNRKRQIEHRNRRAFNTTLSERFQINENINATKVSQLSNYCS